MTAKLLPLFRRHHTYVEAFGGGASLLFAKECSAVEVYNDLDDGLVNLFRVLRDPKAFKEFRRLVATTPYSRAEYNACRRGLAGRGTSVQRAWRFYVVARMSFAGRFANSFGTGIQKNQAASWLSAIEMLPEIHARLMRVQIEQQDFRTILRRYDTPQTLFYLDPPYVASTRRNGKYWHEMTDDDHRELVGICLRLKGSVILSAYCHPLYRPLRRAGWRLKRWRTVCSAAGRTRATGILGQGSAAKMQARVESVYVSPARGADTL